MKSWQPPALLVILLVPAAIGFAIGGPGVGTSVAGLIFVALVVIVLRTKPFNPIGKPVYPELERRLLVVTTFPIEDARTIQLVADEIELGGINPESEIRILTPATNTFLNRWATDLKAARDRAQRDLVISVASLTLAGVDAEAQVGDEDLVQAVEDQLVTFDATEVILVTRTMEDNSVAAESLKERLRPLFRRVTLDGRSPVTIT